MLNLARRPVPSTLTRPARRVRRVADTWPAGNEGASGEFGIGLLGVVAEKFKAGILRNGEGMRAEFGIHGRRQGGRCAFQHVADGLVQVHLAHVKILTNSRFVKTLTN